MKDADTRTTAITAARSLLLREGKLFTLASLCKEIGVSRARLRRSFPTKSTLLAAVLNDTHEEPERAQTSADPIPSVNHHSGITGDSPYAHTVPASGDCEGSVGANNDQPIVEVVQDDSILVRFQTAERAICALDALYETRFAKQSEYIALLEKKLAGFTDGPASHADFIEPPPLISEQGRLEPNVESELSDFESASVALPSTESVPLAVKDIPSTRAASRLQLLAILEKNARLSQRRHTHDLLGLGPVEMAVAILACLLTIACLLWAHEHAHAAEAPSIAVERQTKEGFPFASNVATGTSNRRSSEVAQSTPDLIVQANSGSVLAQTALAEAFLNGIGEERDSLAAARWSIVAAQHGEPSAQFILATLYMDGIKPDPRQAVKWLGAAATQGNVKAMHNLAVAFLSGQGVERDPAMALSWFRNAANLGYRDSAFDLGVLYERGEGVPQNPQQALMWYDKASTAGDTEAAQRASHLRSTLSHGVN